MKRIFLKTFLVLLPVLLLAAFKNDKPATGVTVLDQKQLAENYFQEDQQWYIDNIPFFECSDKTIEQVYYYRWKMYKAHIRNVGANAFVITEFINHVPWDREPFCTINAASMHHIYEGRWLKDQRYMNGYIDNLFQHGGNNRSYSESVADAAYARYMVSGDSVFLMQQLDSMKSIYNQWKDHWEDAKQLYYIPAMPDATEYTIASVDASGGKAGFDSGEAFRPTINSYMYANALAIAKIATMKNDATTSNEYLQKANALKQNVQQYLWNDSMQHFLDRFKQDNQYVHYWNFIRGRELAGFAPWYFNLPDDNGIYTNAWKHLTGTDELLGKYGLRTNEPSYEYYFKQFVFSFGKPGSQWNGPSWPYQTSQAITGMANVLNNYHQKVISNADYVKLLHLFAKQHFLPGTNSINLVENYDPNTGGPIVYYYWSNHYNHSSFNNLVISGLCGIRPSEGNMLTIHPLVDNSIQYFCLDDVLYHGHKLTVIYDRDGTKYKYGKGLTVLVDGEKKELKVVDGKQQVDVGVPVVTNVIAQPVNHALNIRYTNYPVPSASVNNVPDSLFQAIDGRVWYFTEISNRWSTQGSIAKEDWYALDFGSAKNIATIKLYLYKDVNFDVPEKVLIEYDKSGQWIPAIVKNQDKLTITGNTSNEIKIEPIQTAKIRIKFLHSNKQVALTELECY